MQEFKGTPGPWVLLEAGDGITKKVPVDRGNTSILTIVEEDGVKFAAVMDGYDAQLIASAHELLEELQEVDKTLCALQGNIADANKSEPRWNGMWDVIQQRRDAIKAVIEATTKQP